VYRIERLRNPGPIETAELDDLDARCLPYDDRCNKRNTAWWVAREATTGVMVAFAGATYWDPDRCFYLCRAGVLPSARGHGLQRRMIRARVSHARTKKAHGVYTYTTADNHRSANNLIACGFRVWAPAHPWAGNNVIYWWKGLT
jgi:GNAT superfamily N-acetyltransferase